MPEIYLVELVHQIDGKLEDCPPRGKVSSISSVIDATASDICFFDDLKHKSSLQTCKAGAVILHPSNACLFSGPKILHDNPRLALAKLSHIFNKQPEIFGIHPSAILGDNCDIEKDVNISANVVVGNNVVLKRGVSLRAGVVIEDDVVIGNNTELKPNVTVMRNTVIGDNCIIHSASVIGSDGFGYAFDKGTFHKIAHLGRVVIRNDVEIGASTTIDRGTFGDTIIGNGAKLDNQIQIGHNVNIGSNTVVAGSTGIAGSTTVGKNCQIGGSVGISGHLNIVDNVVVTGKSTVAKDIKKPGVYSSTLSVLPQLEWNKCFACLKRLYSFMRKISLRESINE